MFSFVPWGGVAAHLTHNGTLVSLLLNKLDNKEGKDTAQSQSLAQSPNSRVGNEGSGNAFCFLPLPVDTGLPVHVNGFFELSSNRRDIW